MSREKSYLEHSGMPMQATPNAGRVRRAQGPWPSTFSACLAQPGEQKREGMAAVTMPGFNDQIAEVDAEAPKTQRSGEQQDVLGAVNESLADPGLLQRASANSAGAQSGSANPAIAQSALSADTLQSSASSLTSAAMGQAVNSTALSASPAMSVGSAELTSAGGMETRSANEYSTNKQEDAFANSVSGRGAVQEGTTASALQPQVLVQKHIAVQTETLSMSAGPGMVMPLQSGPEFATSEKLKSLTVINSAVGAESVFAPDESFAVPVIPQITSLQFEAARTPMGAGNAMGSHAASPVISASQPQGEKSQQALLDRLNSRPAQQQENSGGRRLHIGNLQITVQRPAVAPAQPSLSSTKPSTQTQPAATPQTFFNPWERHHMAFD